MNPELPSSATTTTGGHNTEAPRPPDDNLELSIIMPCLNEAETLHTCIQKAQAFLRDNNVDGEILIGDNGSTDGSQAIAQRCGARVINVSTRGYGAAIYYATLAAKGKYAIMGDSDDSYDFLNLKPFLQQLRDGYDLVMGNRFLGGIAPGAMPWKNRYIGNPVLTAIGRLFFRCPARDFHCGLRGYSREAFKKMDLRTTGMEFASEMVIKATLLQMAICEVPTTLSPDGRSRAPHLRPWRDGWRHLRFMLLYSPRWLFLIPGLLLMLLGFVSGVLLLLGPVAVGSVAFDVNTLFYSAMAILIGFQAVSFGVLTKVFAIGEGLLPKDPRLMALFKFFTLEVGLAIGCGILLAGLAGTLYALYSWSLKAFGPVDAPQMLRQVIPAGTAIAFGFQVLLTSFFLSVLGLRTRTYDAT